jgi:hypothetical protein
MSRVHWMVDWRPDYGPRSLEDHSHGRWPKLVRVRAHRCYRGSELDVGGPKGGGLLGDSDREV